MLSESCVKVNFSYMNMPGWMELMFLSWLRLYASLLCCSKVYVQNGQFCGMF